MLKNIISWDLGATKCAAGLVEYHTELKTLQCKKTCNVKLTETNSLEHLIQELENKLYIKMSDADAICIGAAGHYDGEILSLFNGYPYEMHFAKIAKQSHWPTFNVIHDYAPVVCATFTSYMHEESNIKHINASQANPHGRRLALGIGTGLGMKDGVLFPNGDFWLGQNEIGHIGITTPVACDSYYLKRHNELMHFLNKTLTFENILSGPGIARLYEFFYPHSQKLTPEEVGLQINNGKASELLDTFTWYLGLFIGTVQLIFMPEGGIWITGGVTLHHLHVFDSPEFTKGIHSSPAYLLQRNQFPLGILCNPEHALYGGGFYATKRLMDLV